MTEIWLPIPGMWPYEASSLGNIGGPRRRPLSAGVGKWGHLHVGLWLTGKRKNESVHRLVCLAFKGAPPTGMPIATHWDGDPRNNVPENLFWGTHKTNAADRERHGRSAWGESVKGKLKAADVLAIRTDGRKQREISEDFGVSQSCVSMIKSRRLWARLEAL